MTTVSPDIGKLENGSSDLMQQAWPGSHQPAPMDAASLFAYAIEAAAVLVVIAFLVIAFIE